MGCYHIVLFWKYVKEKATPIRVTCLWAFIRTRDHWLWSNKHHTDTIGDINFVSEEFFSGHLVSLWRLPYKSTRVAGAGVPVPNFIRNMYITNPTSGQLAVQHLNEIGDVFFVLKYIFGYENHYAHTIFSGRLIESDPTYNNISASASQNCNWTMPMRVIFRARFRWRVCAEWSFSFTQGKVNMRGSPYSYCTLLCQYTANST